MDNLQSKNGNIFLKSLISLGKILFLFVLAYLFIGLFFAQNTIQLIIGFFVVIFITLPTIFLFFFKDKFMEKHPKFVICWKIYRVFYVIFIVLYAGFWIFGTWHLNEVAKTQRTIDFINSKKITLDDVMGKNLPPQPDQKLNDSTISGIDANKNYIRDDVELAIFKEYPNSAKIRAAELQYAQALQLELTQVDSSETLISTIRKEDSAYNCLGDSETNLSLSALNGKEKKLDNIILNTDLRKNKKLDDFKKYMTSYSLPKIENCDLEISG